MILQTKTFVSLENFLLLAYKSINLLQLIYASNINDNLSDLQCLQSCGSTDSTICHSFLINFLLAHEKLCIVLNKAIWLHALKLQFSNFYFFFVYLWYDELNIFSLSCYT